jgi:hypothetical protein
MGCMWLPLPLTDTLMVRTLQHTTFSDNTKCSLSGRPAHSSWFFMFVSVTLASGAVRMARRKVIVKQVAAIENFGSRDILLGDRRARSRKGRSGWTDTSAFARHDHGPLWHRAPGLASGSWAGQRPRLADYVTGMGGHQGSDTCRGVLMLPTLRSRRRLTR